MKVKLRALEPYDIDSLFELENLNEHWYTGNTLAPFSRYQLEQYIENVQGFDIYSAKQLRLMVDCIIDGETKTVGIIDLFDFDPHHQRAGVGILVSPQYQGRGIAAVALKELIHYAFNTLNLHQFYCDIPVSNAISLQLFKKLNFEVTGQKKEWIFVNKKWEDVYFLQLMNK